MRPLLLLAAAFLIAMPSEGTSGAVREPLRVRSGTDGAEGSLRHLIERVARPGDRIVFPTALRVELRRKLTIPRRLAGLTIDGSTATGGMAELVGVRSKGGSFIQIDADRVTLRRLRLSTLPVVFESRIVGDDVVGPSFARVIDVESAGYAIGRPGIKFSFARAFQVRGGVIANDILLVGTRVGVISGVTFKGKGIKLNDDGSHVLQIENNTLGPRGRIVLESETAAATRNRIGAGATLHVWIHAGGRGRIGENSFDGGRLVAQAGGRLDVVGNSIRGTWRGGPGLPGITAGCASDGKRPQLDLYDNEVSGMRIGVKIECGRDAQIALKQDHVERNGTGLIVGAKAVTVAYEVVRDNAGPGISVLTGSRATITRITAVRNGGPGIERKDAEPRPPQLEYEAATGTLRGTACPGCVVELYSAEEGAGRGGAIDFQASVKAGAGGNFAHPLPCPPSGSVTATATDTGRGGTSEFSSDVACDSALGRVFASATDGGGDANRSYCVLVRTSPPQPATKGDVTLLGPSTRATKAFETGPDGRARVVFPITAMGPYIATVSLFGGWAVQTGSLVGALVGDPIGCAAD